MKKTIFVAFLAIFFIAFNSVDVAAQNCSKHCSSKCKDKKTSDNVSKMSIKVMGSCGMCKDRIEKTALEVKGVKTATWDEKSQMLELTYTKSTFCDEVLCNALAEAGHDTEKVKATDESYNSLPACCKYRTATDKKKSKTK